jgi:hypothetical protein
LVQHSLWIEFGQCVQHLLSSLVVVFVLCYFTCFPFSACLHRVLSQLCSFVICHEFLNLGMELMVCSAAHNQ